MDYKNQFVDENSYLVYGSEPDTAYDGSGGGGSGGDAEPLICKYNDGGLDKTLGEIYRAYTDGKSVLYHYNDEGETIDQRAGSWSYLFVIEFMGDDDIGYTSNLRFGDSTFFTDSAPTFDEALALYPVEAD